MKTQKTKTQKPTLVASKPRRVDATLDAMKATVAERVRKHVARKARVHVEVTDDDRVQVLAHRASGLTFREVDAKMGWPDRNGYQSYLICHAAGKRAKVAKVAPAPAPAVEVAAPEVVAKAGNGNGGAPKKNGHLNGHTYGRREEDRVRGGHGSGAAGGPARVARSRFSASRIEAARDRLYAGTGGAAGAGAPKRSSWPFTPRARP